MVFPVIPKQPSNGLFSGVFDPAFSFRANATATVFGNATVSVFIFGTTATFFFFGSTAMAIFFDAPFATDQPSLFPPPHRHTPSPTHAFLSTFSNASVTAFLLGSLHWHLY